MPKPHSSYMNAHQSMILVSGSTEEIMQQKEVRVQQPPSAEKIAVILSLELISNHALNRDKNHLKSRKFSEAREIAASEYSSNDFGSHPFSENKIYQFSAALKTELLQMLSRLRKLRQKTKCYSAAPDRYTCFDIICSKPSNKKSCT